MFWMWRAKTGKKSRITPITTLLWHLHVWHSPFSHSKNEKFLLQFWHRITSLPAIYANDVEMWYNQDNIMQSTTSTNTNTNKTKSIADCLKISAKVKENGNERKKSQAKKLGVMPVYCRWFRYKKMTAKNVLR